MYPSNTPFKTSKTLHTFQIVQNPQQISLPFTIDRIVSVRVRTLSWSVPPFDNATQMIYLSCPELLIHAPSQSTILMPGLISSNQLVHRRNLLGNWTVATLESQIPNYNNNDPQVKINLNKLTSVNKITLWIEDDANQVLRTTPILGYQAVQVVLEIEQQIEQQCQ